MRDEVRCFTASFSKQRTSEKARRLGEVGKGGSDPRVKDEASGNTGVKCVMLEVLTAGEAGATT
jgi:hypothetical protein